MWGFEVGFNCLRILPRYCCQGRAGWGWDDVNLHFWSAKLGCSSRVSPGWAAEPTGTCSNEGDDGLSLPGRGVKARFGLKKWNEGLGFCVWLPESHKRPSHRGKTGIGLAGLPCQTLGPMSFSGCLSAIQVLSWGQAQTRAVNWAFAHAHKSSFLWITWKCAFCCLFFAGCSSGNVSAGPPLPWPVDLTRSLFSAVYSPSNLLCNWQGMSGTFSCHLRGSREHRVSLALKAPWCFWVKNPKY